ncbi:hypothetical protein CMV_009991 [Castanea mollissima]|uniref:HMA domain-containing protein n=1 Tax=Castanea mollissima TaxID=60419 RepID=A0A8J4RGB1_9ROSI|nr:hypothetical protein CMV_009991 [Castanea mollissima]
MESTLSATTTTIALFTVSKALNRKLCRTPLSQCLSSQLLTRRFRCISTNYRHGNPFATSSSSSSLMKLCAASVPPVRRRLECVASSAASFASGGGGGGGGVGGESSGGGGGGGSDGGDAKANLVASGAQEVSALPSDVIVLDVGGMTCGGCAASVKRILESQPQVSSASVNLTTETAVVWPVSEAKVTANWQQQLGEALAKHLTTCGFNSNLRVAGQGAIEGDISP